MIISNENLLMPIIKSTGGMHLTAYLNNDYQIINLKKDIKKVIKSARKLMSPIMSNEEMDIFLAPVQRIIDEVTFLKNFKSNIGIFLTKNYFKIINVPVGVESLCVVSTSFHVKPLLKWMQSDRDFLLLGFDEGAVSLYHGNLHSMNYVDTILFPESMRALRDESEMNLSKKLKLKRIIATGAIEWLNDWIDTLTFEFKPILFIAGNKEVTDIFIKNVGYENLHAQAVTTLFESGLEIATFNKIKTILKIEIQKDNEKNLKEIQLAQRTNMTSNNIFQIGKLATQGNVRKLIIADDVNIFGIMDRNTGSLLLHTEQKNHFDDDVLDDLAQEVLSHGGEVVLMPRNQIPGEYPAMAITCREPIHFQESLMLRTLNTKNTLRHASI
jgi:hypothetical protein